MPLDGVIGQCSHGFRVAVRGEVLEGADAEVTRRHAGEDGTWQDRLAYHRLARGDCGKRASCGNTQRGHGFAEDVFAEDGAKGCATVAAAGEGGAAGAFELDVIALAVTPDDFAEQVGAAVAELGYEIAELVARICHCERLGALCKAIAGEDFDACLKCQRFGIEAKAAGEFDVELNQAWGGDRGRIDAGIEALGQPGIGVVEGKREGRGGIGVNRRQNSYRIRCVRWSFGRGAYCKDGWRKRRDSNPRYPFRYASFQDWSHQPLGHSSVVR